MPPQKQRIMKTIYLIEVWKYTEDWKKDFRIEEQAFADLEKAKKYAREQANDWRRYAQVKGNKPLVVFHKDLCVTIQSTVDKKHNITILLKEIEYDDGE